MAIGESRHQVKRDARAAGARSWSLSDGRIHSYQTRTDYQEHVLHFLNWCRDTHRLHTLRAVDQHAGALASAYLAERLAAGRSAYTLQAERAALRLFFDDAQLAGDVTLPQRRREAIRQNRGDQVARLTSSGRGFDAARWQTAIAFLRAAGLRRSEALHIRVRDVFRDHDGGLRIQVWNGKGGKGRIVPVLAGHEADVLALTQGRAGDVRVLEHLPVRLRIHALRRAYAQRYYQQLSGRALPPAEGVLKASDYDAAAALEVSRALGHNRLDVVLRHYLR